MEKTLTFIYKVVELVLLRRS